MDLVSDFTIDSQREVEDLVIYDDDYNEPELTDFLKKVLDENLISVGEKCEGSIEVDDTDIRIEYRFCSELGEDWDSDVWEDDTIVIPRENYGI